MNVCTRGMRDAIGTRPPSLEAEGFPAAANRRHPR